MKEAKLLANLEKWAKKRPNWMKEPIAIIDSPLHYLRTQLTRRKFNAETKEFETTVSPLYYMARDFAKAGDGYSVNRIAAFVNENPNVQ